MKKRMVNLVLAIGLIVSMVTVPVSAAGNGEEQGEKARKCQKSHGLSRL